MNIEFLKNLGISEEASSAILAELENELLSEYDRGLSEGLSHLDEFKLNLAIEDELSKADAKNPQLLKSLIDFDSVYLEDGELIGLLEQIDLIKSENPFLFNEDAPAPKFSRRAESSDKITKKDFDAMPYAERVKLFSTNPSLYNQLKG